MASTRNPPLFHTLHITLLSAIRKTPCGVVGYHVWLQLDPIIYRKVTGSIPVEEMCGNRFILSRRLDTVLFFFLFRSALIFL